jgi:hypothetical protein
MADGDGSPKLVVLPGTREGSFQVYYNEFKYHIVKAASTATEMKFQCVLHKSGCKAVLYQIMTDNGDFTLDVQNNHHQHLARVGQMEDAQLRNAMKTAAVARVDEPISHIYGEMINNLE